MAIYHANMRSIGRSTHAAGTAGAHVRYITRTNAEPIILAQHMPEDRWKARAWLDRQEQADRANARVCDKLNIALPRELDSEQRQAVVLDFCQKITQERCPFYAVIHEKEGNDRDNPHAHIMLRDRDFETGKRVMRLSDNARDRIKAGFEHPKAMDQVRELWADVCNRHLERAGYEERIDHRTLKAQKIDREPQIHVGAWSNRVAANDGERPQSQNRLVEAWGKERLVVYNHIDQGKTRAEHNAEIIDLEQRRQAKAAEIAARQNEADRLEKRKRGLGPEKSSDQREATRKRETTPQTLVKKDFDKTSKEAAAAQLAAREAVLERRALNAAKKSQEQRQLRARRIRQANWQRAEQERIAEAKANAVAIRKKMAQGRTVAERAAKEARLKKAQLDQAHREALRSGEQRLKGHPKQTLDIPSGIKPPVRDDFAEAVKSRQQTEKEAAEQRQLERYEKMDRQREEFNRASGQSRGDTGRTRDGPKR